MYYFKLSLRSLNRLKGVEPVLLAIVVDAVRCSPYDFGIPQHGGKRSADEQNLLFKNKKTRLDGFVKKSYHQSGKAFDIYGIKDGRVTWEPEVMEGIAIHIKQTAWNRYKIRLRWGGEWETFKDMPHFQM